MKLQKLKLADIKPYENNPRRNDDAVNAVAESIRQCSYITPILVDEDHVIIAGHTRYKALMALGETEAECLICDGLTEEQKKKYRFLDNKTGGGGSSMGYKLAGFDVVGNCEIDPDMMKVYKRNNHPKHSFLMDIRDFLKLPDEKMPEELFHLDVLDGSPPCSVFSTAGVREEGWNTEKVFREGQAKQRLDDLFLYFIAIAKRLQPKVVIAENVKGIIIGNAKGWVNQIVKGFELVEYD